MGRTFIVGGNWKCNGTIDEVKKIVATLNEAEVPSEDVVEVVVSPPFVFLTLVKSLLRSDFYVAAQNCWVRKGGAFTGEISAEMLVNLGIPWVILGHSERRLLTGESNEFVADKVAYALSQGIKVIACVGETLEQRDSGSTSDVVFSQTRAIADKVLHWNNIVIAYEPVWAIGTGKVATPVQAQESNREEKRLWISGKGENSAILENKEPLDTWPVEIDPASKNGERPARLFQKSYTRRKQNATEMPPPESSNPLDDTTTPPSDDSSTIDPEVHSALRKWFLENVGADVAESIRIIYGGSVNGANCRELAGQPDVDGFLVGGASLKPEFVDIIQSAVAKTTV